MAENAAKDERMAAEERLLLALNTLKTLIEAPAGERREASLRRQLTAVRAKWSAYDTAHFVYLKKIQAEDDRMAERGSYNGQYETTEGILERAELLLDEFAAAAAPLPVDNDVIFNIASQEQALFYAEARKEVASVEARLAEVEEGAARTKQELETLDKELDGVVEQMAAAALLSKQMIKGKPEMAEGILRGEGEITSELKEKIAKQRRTIASRMGAVAEPVVGNGNRNGRDQSYMYERRKLPRFEGARRDYPSFRREWQNNVGGGQFSAEYELREIKQNTPSEVEPDLKNLKTITEVWEILDRKYGRTMELASELISGLQNFKPSYKAKTESACFAELDREWTKVYNDLEEVQKLEVLNHEPTLSGFAKKLPSVESKKAYIALRLKMMQECEEADPPTTLSELEVMKKFMRAERRRQELLEGLVEEKDLRIREPRQGTGRKDSRQCYQCGEVGHVMRECPKSVEVKGSSHFNYQPVALPCPACNQKHTYSRDGKEMPSTKLGMWCAAFMSLSVNEKVALIEKVNGCAGCLDFTGRHQRDDCRATNKEGMPWTCSKEVNGQRCGKKHHIMLHGTTNNFANYVQVNRSHVSIAPTDEEIRNEQSTTTLMQLQLVPVAGSNTKCLTFFDTGSNIHLVRGAFAQKLGLKGKRIKLDLTITGQRKETRDTTLYWVPLVDRQGTVWKVMAYEMDNITAPMEGEDVTLAEKLFPMVDKGALERPSGPVDLLVGINMAAIFPYLANREEHLRGNLMLMTSIFGSGFLLSGDHAGISANMMMESPEALKMTRAGRVNQVMFTMKEKPNRMSLKTIKNEVFSFPECEELGVDQPRRCGGCTTCIRCSSTAVALTRREQEELTMIEENIELDQENKQVTFHYPLIKDPKQLIDNGSSALARARRLEKKLISQEKIEAYNQEMQNFVDRGIFVELSREEMDEWPRQGKPVNYISHQGVENPKSATTKLRVVSNSSLVNNNGLSYNDLLPKGPNSMVSLLEAILHWRSYPHCVVWDLTKAYNTVKTFGEEMHMRRLFWRFGEVDQPWRVFGISAMHFGDRCATCALQVALSKVADAGAHIDPDAAEMIKQGYVDDGIGGGSKEDVDRLMGEETWREGKPTYSGTVAEILQGGGFKVKVMVRNGETRPEVAELLGSGVLGLPWKPQQDTIVMHLGVNLSPKTRSGCRVGPELNSETVEQIDHAVLTRREVVSQIYSIFDPLGLLAPIVIKFKLLLQRLAAAGGGWDDELDEELAALSREVLKAMVLAEDVIFPRSATPEGVLLCILELLGWWDGGKPASAACLYTRYEKEVADASGTHVLRLVMGKARVTPSAKGSEKLRKSTPRTEMRGLTMVSRMVTAIIPGMQQKPNRISLFGDSECTISAVDCMDGQLDIWFGNRVAEVLEHMEAWRKMGIEVDELHHWPGASNIADIATKGKAVLDDVGPESEWQNGPWQARLPRDRWPATREFKREVPQEERRLKNYATYLAQGAPELGIFTLTAEVMEGVHTYQQARGIVARWIQAKVRGRREAIREAPLVKALGVADKLLYMVGTVDTNKEMAKGRKSRLIGLGPQWKKGRYVTTGRLGKGMYRVLGVTELAILMPTTRLARLVMQQAHEEDHKGSTITLWRSRSNAWIWRGRGLAKKVCRECLPCVARKAMVLEQRMGQLPLERVATGCLPFTFICLDLLGPTLVKDMVKKRCTMKVWPMVFVCQATGALHMGVMHDYSTEALLLQWDHFTAIRGVPAKVVSDRGSQLTSAGNVVAWGASDDGKQDGSKVWTDLENVSARRGTKWQFVPAGAQFRNGLAEARVKAVKQTLWHVLMSTLVNGKPTLTYAELATVLAQVANIVNDRPIWAKVLTEGDLVPLTVNQLLLGRTSTSPLCEQEEGEMPDERDFMASSGFVNNVLNTWWSLWKQQGFASLLPYNKLKDGLRHKNLREGDVCLLQYENKVKNTYRLCRVKEVKVSEEGLVRTVTIAYRAKRKGKVLPYVAVPMTEMEVAVQRLVLLVPGEKVDAGEEEEAWTEG